MSNQEFLKTKSVSLLKFIVHQIEEELQYCILDNSVILFLYIKGN